MDHLDLVLAVALLVVGLHGLFARGHLVKKLIAVNIVQVAVIVFFVTLAARRDASPPIAVGPPLAARSHVNPLPHALMLTAIVVGVSTTGLALSLLVRIQRRFGTLEEDELLDGRSG